MLSRIFDIIVSLVGVIMLLLMLPVIAVLIKLDSPGPVFYAGRRVGQGGKLFKMYKFRTMYETPQPLGVSVSPQGDPRITQVGLWLRRLKLNEFPQFFNVLKGDMTLVGPRPETPDMAAQYPPEARKIFSIKPGLVGPNQILGRNEEELYPRDADPVQFYLNEILPRKLPLDLQYLEEKSFGKEVKYLLWGTWVTITGAISRQHLADSKTQLLMLATDTGCCLASFTLAHLIRYEVFPLPEVTQAFWAVLPLTVLTRIPVLFYFGCYQIFIRFLSLRDLKRVFQGVFLGSLLLIFISYFTGALFKGSGRGVFIIDWLCLTMMLLGYRVLLKTLRNRFMKEESNGRLRVALIWGSGEQGLWCLRYLRQSQDPRYEVVGFIDDNISLQHKSLDGLRVLGDHHHLEILARIYHIQELFVAIPEVFPGRLERVQELCRDLNIALLRFMPRSVREIGPAPPVAESTEARAYSAA